MAYRGAYVRDHVVSTTSENSRQNWGTGVDPRHSEGQWGSDQGTPPLTYPPVPSTPESVIDDYDPTAISTAPRVSYDREPAGHDGYGIGRSRNFYTEQALDGERHQRNLGATLKNTATMVMRSVSQGFRTAREPSLPPAQNDGSAGVTGFALRALRGFNSLALNNPGDPLVNFSGNYTRQGFEISRYTPRTVRRRTLKHTQRPIYLNTATTAHVTEGPQGRNYSPYGSPFASVANLSVGVQRPMQRREPRPWDEDATTDGSGEAQASPDFVSWGL